MSWPARARSAGASGAPVPGCGRRSLAPRDHAWPRRHAEPAVLEGDQVRRPVASLEGVYARPVAPRAADGSAVRGGVVAEEEEVGDGLARERRLEPAGEGAHAAAVCPGGLAAPVERVAGAEA